MQCDALISNGIIDQTYTTYSKVMKSAKEEIYNAKVNHSVQGSFDK